MTEPASAIAALRALQANVAQPFAGALAMPKAVYTDPAFADAEERLIFARAWTCAGRLDALAPGGAGLTAEVAGHAVQVWRDAAGGLCAHAGQPVRVESWLGWIMLTLNQSAPAPSVALAEVEALVGYLDMGSYVEGFRQEFRWATNWKVLAENFMESYHLPACHAGTIGGSVDLAQMTCPEGFASFNYHYIVKNDTVPLSLAHPSNTRLTGDQRRITWLLSVYPAHLITLTPGYFWYLCLTPDGPGHVKVLFGGGMAADWAADPDAAQHFAALRALLDDVNIEDKGCTERVYRGLCASLSAPGPLSHLERPNFEFAQYIARMMAEGLAGADGSLTLAA